MRRSITDLTLLRSKTHRMNFDATDLSTSVV